MNYVQTKIVEHVHTLREGDDAAKTFAAQALGIISYINAANAVAIAEAGGIAQLVEIVRVGSVEAKAEAAWALDLIARNDDNGTAIAEAVGLNALVELARHGRVTFKGRRLVFYNATLLAKRKAALVVAALLGGCVPDSVPRVIMAVIGSYL